MICILRVARAEVWAYIMASRASITVASLLLSLVALVEKAKTSTLELELHSPASPGQLLNPSGIGPDRQLRGAT
jgi:hypothetical protein